MPFEIRLIPSEHVVKTDFLKNTAKKIEVFETIKDAISSFNEQRDLLKTKKYVREKISLIDEKIKFFQTLQEKIALSQTCISIQINLKNSNKQELENFLNLMENTSYTHDSFVLKNLRALLAETISNVLADNINEELLIPEAWKTELVKLISLSRHPISVLKAGSIQANGKILNEDSIQKVKEYFQKNPNEKFFKGVPLIENGPVSRIIKINDTLLALYEPRGTQLGVGATGKTVLSQDINTGKWAALKEQHFPENTKKIDSVSRLADSMREVFSLESERELLGATSISNPHPKDPENMQQISTYTLMELAHGTNLVDAKENGNISEKNLCTFALSAADALNRIHYNNRLHRDVKLENIVWDPETQSVKFVDFGSSTLIKQKKQIVYSEEAIGTLEYLAPESTVKDNNGHMQYSEKSDVFSLGVVFAEMLYKKNDGYGQVRDSKNPGAEFNWKDFLNKETMGNLSSEEAVIFKLSQQMTIDEPQKRISMDEVINSLNLFNNYMALEKKIENQITDATLELSTLPDVVKKKAHKAVKETLQALIDNKNNSEDPITKAMMFAKIIKKHTIEIEHIESHGISKIFKKLIRLVDSFLCLNQPKLSTKEANNILEHKLLCFHKNNAHKQKKHHMRTPGPFTPLKPRQGG